METAFSGGMITDDARCAVVPCLVSEGEEKREEEGEEGLAVVVAVTAAVVVVDVVAAIVVVGTRLLTPDPLTLRELVADLCARPNHCGKPCRRLKPPGGRRSSSVALTVSVSEEPVVYV